MRPKPIVGWLLVWGLRSSRRVTVFFTGSFASVDGPSTGDWADGAWSALQIRRSSASRSRSAWRSWRCVFGRGVVRCDVVASVVIVGSLPGAGGRRRHALAQRQVRRPRRRLPTVRARGDTADPAMQAALDELEHPGLDRHHRGLGRRLCVGRAQPHGGGGRGRVPGPARRRRLGDRRGRRDASLIALARRATRSSISECGEAGSIAIREQRRGVPRELLRFSATRRSRRARPRS